MGTGTYATREDVKSALDSAETARDNAQVDRALEAATRTVEGLLKRKFYPLTTTIYKDWPNHQYARSWRLWLDQHELISVSSLVSGGTTISSSDYFLYPPDGPPYTRIEIDLGSTAAFSVADTQQRSIAITGVFGHSADEASAGTLAAAITTTSATTCNVSDSYSIGVGSIVKVDSERMIVTEKTMLTTGQTLQTPLTASNGNVTVAVTTGTAYTVGEIILLDSERMLIVDISGNNLTVKRAWDGSVLATHSGSTIYAPRTLTVTRGALGTTAATHSSGASITRHVVPGLVRELALAQALVNLGLGNSGYGDYSGQGETQRRVSGGRGLAAIRDDAMAAYGRQARSRAV